MPKLRPAGPELCRDFWFAAVSLDLVIHCRRTYHTQQ